MKKFIIAIAAILLSSTVLAGLPKIDTSMLKPSDLKSEYCDSNSNIIGYLTIINEVCGYKLGKQQSEQIKGINKVCVKKQGQDHVYDVTLDGMKEAKHDLETYERGSVCKGNKKAYKDFYN